VVDPRLDTLAAPDDVASSCRIASNFHGVLLYPRAVVML
jgi:hypothetical protein